MSNRNLKLALAVDLINLGKENNLLDLVQEIMLGFKEVGKFLGLDNTKNSLLNANHVKESFSLQFENCTLDLDLVSNPQTKSQTIQNFNIRKV